MIQTVKRIPLVLTICLVAIEAVDIRADNDAQLLPTGARSLRKSPPLTTENDPVRTYLKKSPIQERIVGGIPSEQGAYPFFGHSTGMFLCGGTFVHEDILLTAAHCLNTFVEDVIVGSNDIVGRDGAERIPIDTVLPHPDYNNVTEVNDIMLVKLERPSSAPLVNWNLDPNLPVDDQEVKVIGFGQQSDGGDISFELLEVDISVIDFDTCSGLLAGIDITDERQICAGDLAGGKDSCQGDSGGPLLGTDNVQYGLVSFGIGCANPNTPAIYTRVSNYQEWIRQGICDLAANPPESCIEEATGEPTAAPTGEEATSVPTPADPAETAEPTVAQGTETPTIGGTTLEPTVPVDDTASPTIGGSTAEPTAGEVTEEPTASEGTAEPTMADATGTPTMGQDTAEPTMGEVTVAPTTREDTDSPTVAEITLPPTMQADETDAPTASQLTLAPTILVQPTSSPVRLTPAPVAADQTATPTTSPVAETPPPPVTMPSFPPVNPDPAPTPTTIPIIPPFAIRPPVSAKPPILVGKGKGKGRYSEDSYSNSYSAKYGKGKGGSKSKSSAKSSPKSGKGPYYHNSEGYYYKQGKGK